MSKTGTQITFIEQLGPNSAIGADDNQWIVLKAVGPASPHGLSWHDKRWKAVGFIHSNKQALIACLKAKGLKPSKAGQAALARQADEIYRWQRAP